MMPNIPRSRLALPRAGEEQEPERGDRERGQEDRQERPAATLRRPDRRQRRQQGDPREHESARERRDDRAREDVPRHERSRRDRRDEIALVVAVHAVLEHLQAARHHRPHEDREADDRRPEVRQVVEVRIRLQPDRRRAGRHVLRAPTPPARSASERDSSASKEKRSVLSPMNEGAGPGGESPNGQHPDAAIVAAPQARRAPRRGRRGRSPRRDAARSRAPARRGGTPPSRRCPPRPPPRAARSRAAGSCALPRISRYTIGKTIVETTRTGWRQSVRNARWPIAAIPSSASREPARRRTSAARGAGTPRAARGRCRRRTRPRASRERSRGGRCGSPGPRAAARRAARRPRPGGDWNCDDASPSESASCAAPAATIASRSAGAIARSVSISTRSPVSRPRFRPPASPRRGSGRGPGSRRGRRGSRPPPSRASSG